MRNHLGVNDVSSTRCDGILLKNSETDSCYKIKENIRINMLGFKIDWFSVCPCLTNIFINRGLF